MKILVGLGNPGKEFEKTRHNLGFMVLDVLKPDKFKLQKKFQAEIARLDDLLLLKPQTFMNDSGKAVKKVLDYYRVKKYDDLYVIHDDLDIGFGEYKFQFSKGPQRHNGILSIEHELKTKDFWRIRIGISTRMQETREEISEDKDFVLGKFSLKEKKIIDKVIKKIVKELINEKA